ncbi:MAG: hypothetical protein WC879_17600 [Melioribacteraceae bacterium]
MSYRYFLRKFGDYYSEIFRIPDNGKNIINNIPLLEKYIPKNKWSNNSKDIKGLLEDISTGYFSEISDEITDVKTLKIIRRIDEANEAGKQE